METRPRARRVRSAHQEAGAGDAPYGSGVATDQSELCHDERVLAWLVSVGQEGSAHV